MVTLHGMKQNPWNPSRGIAAKKQGMYHITFRSIFASLLLFLSFIFFKCLIWFVFCGWALNSNGFCFPGLRFYFYEFCFVGGVKFNWVLFYLKQEDHQNSKTVNTKKKKWKRRPLTTNVWVHAREIGNKKKKKKEERRRQSVGSTNFDIFTIGRKKKKVL